jgi:hypothetical protein
MFYHTDLSYASQFTFNAKEQDRNPTHPVMSLTVQLCAVSRCSSTTPASTFPLVATCETNWAPASCIISPLTSAYPSPPLVSHVVESSFSAENVARVSWLWPRGTGSPRTLPSAVTSTVDHPRPGLRLGLTPLKLLLVRTYACHVFRMRYCRRTCIVASL